VNPAVILHYAALRPALPNADYDFVFEQVPESVSAGWRGSVRPGRALGLVLLAKALEAAAAGVSLAQLCRAANGKPMLAGEWHFSLSYSASHVGVALSSVPIGFDWEAAAAVTPRDLRLWPATQRPLGLTDATQQWVAIEAVLKAHGGGLRSRTHLAFTDDMASVGAQSFHWRSFAVAGHAAALAAPQRLGELRMQLWQPAALPTSWKDWHNARLDQQ
jgi:hypothetical protein